MKTNKVMICIRRFASKGVDVFCSFLKKGWHLISNIINVNSMSLLIAAIAAFISYRALEESKVQRETMYRPELYVGETKFYADLTDTSKITYYRIEKDSIIRTETVHEPWMKINNVGMGSALHVEGTSDFRLEVMSKAMRAMKIKRKTIYDNYDTYIHGDDSLKLGVGSGIKWHEDYILPLYQTQDECVKEISKYDFGNMIKAALWLNGVLKTRFQGYIIPVVLKYKDINEKWYVKETWMQVQCYTNENKTGMRLKICSGIAQKEYMNEHEKWLYGEETE